MKGITFTKLFTILSNIILYVIFKQKILFTIGDMKFTLVNAIEEDLNRYTFKINN